MRFLNTTTLQFEHVLDSELDSRQNRYAILSHRWFANEDEVTYEDLTSSTDVSYKKGFAKIKGFCKLASSQNCRFGWVDTCCINKGNSSELSEAINSMYLWYSLSKICIVYLPDVPHRKLEDSEWFDRGWTLQELIAPKAVAFFDKYWNPLGTKAELLAEVSRKTRIPATILNHTSQPSTCSVAQRFSWAATRITTRVEDRAYSLMGLFNIHMAMIYGERENAFIRLQHEIIQKSKDESIFAWTMEYTDRASKTYSGLYAPSPSAYINCREMVQTPGSHGFSEEHGELSMRVEILPNSPGTYKAILHCASGVASDRDVFIVLARSSESGNRYLRVRDPMGVSQGTIPAIGKLERLEGSEVVVPRYYNSKEIRVPLNPSEPPKSIFYGFWLRTIELPGHTRSHPKILSNCPTSEPDYICQQSEDQGNTGIARMEEENISDGVEWSKIRWIKFGFTKAFHPVLWLANDTQSTRLKLPFERAVLSMRSSVRSQEHEEAMKEDLLSDFYSREDIQRIYNDNNPTYRRGDHLYNEPTCPPIKFEWPEGRAVLVVDRRIGLQDFFIDELNLKISVRLQPYSSPSTAFSRRNDAGGLPQEPMKVWVVDIVEASRPERRTAGLLINRSERYIDRLSSSLSTLSLSYSDEDEDLGYCCTGLSCFFRCTEPCLREKRLEQREERRRKREERRRKRERRDRRRYERDAYSRVLRLL